MFRKLFNWLFRKNKKQDLSAMQKNSRMRSMIADDDCNSVFDSVGNMILDDECYSGHNSIGEMIKAQVDAEIAEEERLKAEQEKSQLLAEKG